MNIKKAYEKICEHYEKSYISNIELTEYIEQANNFLEQSVDNIDDLELSDGLRNMYEDHLEELKRALMYVEKINYMNRRIKNGEKKTN